LMTLSVRFFAAQCDCSWEQYVDYSVSSGHGGGGGQRGSGAAGQE
jgi:hypothetical protein